MTSSFIYSAFVANLKKKKSWSCLTFKNVKGLFCNENALTLAKPRRLFV